MTASISNSAKAQQLKADKQPRQPWGTAQAALGDSCLQQPRQDAANLINSPVIGATGPCHRPPRFWRMSSSSDSIQQQLTKALQLKATR